MQNNLRAIRKRKGYTLKTLSEKTGLSIGAIGNFETDERGISQDSLEKVASALSVTVAEILHNGAHSSPTPPIDKPEPAACPRCAEKDKEIGWLKEQLSKALDALASKPSPVAGLACGAPGPGAKERRNA